MVVDRTFASKLYDLFNGVIKDNIDNINSIEFTSTEFYPNKSRMNPKIRMSMSEPEFYDMLGSIQNILITVNLDIYTNYYSDSMLKSLDLPYYIYKIMHGKNDSYFKEKDNSNVYVISVVRNSFDYYVTDEENEVVSQLSFNVALEDYSAVKEDDYKEYIVSSYTLNNNYEN